MTKVGAYSILRVYTLVFGPDVPVSQGLVGDWLQPAALVTLAIGSIGPTRNRCLLKFKKRLAEMGIDKKTVSKIGW